MWDKTRGEMFHFDQVGIQENPHLIHQARLSRGAMIRDIQIALTDYGEIW